MARRLLTDNSRYILVGNCLYRHVQHEMPVLRAIVVGLKKCGICCAFLIRKVQVTVGKKAWFSIEFLHAGPPTISLRICPPLTATEHPMSSLGTREYTSGNAQDTSAALDNK